MTSAAAGRGDPGMAPDALPVDKIGWEGFERS